MFLGFLGRFFYLVFKGLMVDLVGVFWDFVLSLYWCSCFFRLLSILIFSSREGIISFIL